MISILLAILAGIFNACMDVVSFRYEKSIFRNLSAKYFNPAYSWQNKWKGTNQYRKEKFFGSSTIFVFLTDFWHLCKFLMILSMVTAMVFYTPTVNVYVDVLILYSSFTIAFEIFFSKILVHKK